MLKQDKAVLVLMPVLLVAFGFGVVRLFQLRFEKGDVYPRYSSLRADPLGTKALYEGLENMRALTVQRFIRPLNRLPEGRDTTLFVLGAGPADMSSSTEDEYRQLEQFMFDGGRVVISLLPSNTRPRLGLWEDAKQKNEEKKIAGKNGRKTDDHNKPGGRRKKPLDGDAAGPGAKIIPLKERWKVSFAYEDLPRNADDVFESVLASRSSDLELPQSLVWHTALYFEAKGPNWRVIYARDKHPVMIERAFGGGSLVLSADSYFLSNEAMRKERRPELLAWLAGPNARLLFDETHLGVTEDPGIAALIRKYRLHGLVIGLLLLAGLFVWKNAVAFVPPSEAESKDARADTVAGRESAAGFVNLLRRSIPSSEILAACMAEWTKTSGHDRAVTGLRSERVARVMADEEAKPVRHRNATEAYRQISKILSERSTM